MSADSTAALLRSKMSKKTRETTARMPSSCTARAAAVG
jgi:hypothetical protein